MRRRLYLMRHGAVDYVDARGRPVAPDQVPLTAEGRAQGVAARALLEGVELDRVIASGLPRTMETAELAAPGRTIETWPDTDPGDAARMTLGQIRQGMGQYARAIEVYESVRTNSSKRLDARTRAGATHWQQSQALRRQGKIAEADAEVQKAIDVLKDTY